MSSADTDVKTEDKDSLPPPKKFINTNLLSLKCLLFFFFSGMGCLLPFLPLHMLAVGLSTKEIQFISMISPCIAILGPLIAGPIADRASASSSSSSSPVKNNSNPSTGRCLRLLIAVCCIFTAFFYSLLLIVPQVQRIDLPQELRPGVKFTCDSQGALIHQERCRDSIGCHRWSDEDFVGNLLLKNCEYTCSNSDSRKYRRKYSQTSPIKIPATAVFNDSPLKNDVDEDELGVIPLKTVTNRSKRQVYGDFKEPPHVCHSNKKGKDVCHVFTENEVTENVQVSLMQATNAENSDEWCIFPIQQFFLCRIPTDMEIIAAKRNETCVVECKVEQPYILEDSVLAESQCRQIFGNPQLTFWMYFGIRSLADIFPTAALSLIDAATVIATRETSLGRGDVGRQLAFGSLGFGIFGPLAGYLTTILGPKSTSMCYPPIIISAALVLIAAFVALAAKGMPLGPPEWCWRTSSGMLALPMSSVHKYVGETTALFFILIIMGAFSSAIDTYLPLHLLHLNGDEFSIGLSLTIGAIPAIIFLWKSENFVDYCGHSNLLITAFIFYIVRFTGLSLVPDVWWSLIAGSLEFFTLGIMWITTILYFRHLIPRSMTTTGQSLPVIAHFCLGRALGAVIGANVHRFYKGDEVESMRFIYQCMAVASAIIATIYFIVYHGMLKPRCHAQSVQNNQRSHPTVVQVIEGCDKIINGNGNYAPLRVYHSGMGRKGQFRY